MSQYANEPQRVEFFLGGKDFPKLDTLSESDPFICVSSRNIKNSQFVELGRTEIITDRAAPEFKKRFTIDFIPENKTELKFDLYDADAETTDLKKSDFIGTAVVALETIVNASGRNVQWPVNDSKGKPLAKAQLLIKPEVLAEDAKTVSFSFAGDKLEKVDLMSQSDPFVEILRKRKDGTYVVVAATEVVKDNASPVWKPLNVAVTTLSADGRDDAPLLLRVSDHNAAGAKLIGQAEATLKQLTSQKRFELKNPTDKPAKPHGALLVNKADVSTDAKLQKENDAIFSLRRRGPARAIANAVGGKTNDSGSNVMVILAVLILLVAAGAGAFFFMKNKK